MQISNLVGQYNSSTASAAEGVSPTKGVERLVSTVRSLTKGNIFEGTINYSKNGQVILGLSNGQQLSARLADNSLKLLQGDSMFFQVKSNDGEQIQIAPYKVAGAGANLTLISALSAAGLPMEGDFLSMVDKMMQEQMPIDKGSLNEMAKLIVANKDANVSTLVEMKKLGIPITKEMVAQYENYQNDKQSIMTGLDSYMDSLPKAMGDESLPVESLQNMNSQVLSVITEGLEEVVVPMEEQNALIIEEQVEVSAEATVEEEPVVLQEGEAVELEEEQVNTPVLEQPKESVPHTLAHLLKPKQIQNLDGMLREVVWNTSEERMGMLSGNDSSVGILNKIQRAISGENHVDKNALVKLLNSKEFQALVKDALEQQWLIKPEELAGENNKISKLYDKLQKQLNQMEQVIKATGQNAGELMQMSTELKSNVDFMNQINQFYQYVQIPLKMSGQNASGELYVYTNRKNLSDENEELSAFLHLDLDNLGSTDVSVKMLHKDVNTKFYMSSDESYALVQKNWPILEERLKKKGYNITINVSNESKHVNVVNDLLKKDMPATSHVKRYSFDIRA